MSHLPYCFSRTIIVTLVAAIVHGNAIAEEIPSRTASGTSNEVKLPTITVSAPAEEDLQTQGSVAIESTTLRALRPATSDSASLLKEVPGLTLQGAGGVSNLPVIRGMADDRNRIKVDGMDLISACGNHMNPPLSYIDPNNVGSATVIAGITPVSLGGDSIGSTIQVESTAPLFATQGAGAVNKVELGAFYRGNGNARGATLNATLASETLSLNYNGATAKSEDYKAGADFKTQTYVNDVGDLVLDNDEVGSTMYKSTNQSLALAMRKENHLLEVKLGMQDIPYQGYPNQRMDMTGNDSTHANLNYKGQYEWGQLDMRAYREHTRHKMQFGEDKLFWYGATAADDGIPCTPSGGNTGCAAGMPMDTEGFNTGFTLRGNIALTERDTVRVGSEGQRYRLDDWWDPSGKGMWPETYWNIHDGERNRLALFGEWEAQWNPEWLTQLGIRSEQVRMNAGEIQGYATATSATPWNTMIAPKYIYEAAAFNSADREIRDNNVDLTTLARFTPDEMHTIELGYSRKNRSPNLYERYTWSTNGMSMRMINMTGDGNGYVGNLELTPELAHSVSASFDWHAPGTQSWNIVASPYYTYVSDYIDARRCSSADVDARTTNSECTDLNLTTVDNFVYLKYVNESAHIYGMDISSRYPLIESSAYGSLTATGKVSYVRGKNGATDDNLYNMMPLNARVALKQQVANWSNSVEAELVDAKDRVSATRNEMQTAGYGLLHLRSSYEWQQARVDVGIENLLNRFYNHPLGGTYLGEGKTMSGTAVAWGTPVPGMGRSFYAGVNLKF